MFFYVPVGRARVLEHEGPRLRGQLRLAAAQPASLGGASHGGHDVPPHGPRLLHRRLPGPARAQLARRRCAPPGDAAAFLHWLPAAMGPARLLGRDRRHQHRPRSAAGRRLDSVPPPGRHGDRAGDAAAVLRAARVRAARGRAAAVRLPHVADQEGRRSRGHRAVAERTSAPRGLPPLPRRATRSSALRAAPASRHSPRPRSRRRTSHSPRPSWCDGSCSCSCSSST